MAPSRVRSVIMTAALAGLFSTSSAYAADDGYQNVFSSVLGAVGLLKSDESDGIDYRERAPLVLPPKMELNKPAQPGAARTAAWPQDPDVIKRRKAAEDARAPSLNLLGNDKAEVSKEELMKGRTAGTPASAVRANQCGNNGNARNCLVVNPNELEAEHQHFVSEEGDSSSKELAPGTEPERKYLTEPPKGYRVVTRVVKVTTEPPKPRIDNSNPKAALVYQEKPDE